MENTNAPNYVNMEYDDRTRRYDIYLQAIISKLHESTQKDVKAIIRSLQSTMEVQGLLHHEIVNNVVGLQKLIRGTPLHEEGTT